MPFISKRLKHTDLIELFNNHKIDFGKCRTEAEASSQVPQSEVGVGVEAIKKLTNSVEQVLIHLPEYL